MSIRVTLYGLKDTLQRIPKLGVVVPTCNPSTWSQRQEGHGFEANLGYIHSKTLSQENKRNMFLGFTSFGWIGSRCN
jgi:hypothetical protein